MRLLVALAILTMSMSAGAHDGLKLRSEGERLNGQAQWGEGKAKLEASIEAYKAGNDDPEGLSRSYSLLSLNRSGAQDYVAAAAAAENELEIIRTFTGKRDSDSRDEDLADTLEKLAYFYRQAGLHGPALRIQEEAVAINRHRVAEPDPADDQGTPALAESLSRLGEIKWGIGDDKAGSLAAFNEAVTLRRQIASDRPAAVHSANLAELLEYLFIVTSEQKYRDESVAILKLLPAYYGPKSDTWMRDLPKLGAFKQKD